jgi:hypothetical protein
MWMLIRCHSHVFLSFACWCSICLDCVDGCWTFLYPLLSFEEFCDTARRNTAARCTATQLFTKENAFDTFGRYKRGQGSEGSKSRRLWIIVSRRPRKLQKSKRHLPLTFVIWQREEMSLKLSWMKSRGHWQQQHHDISTYRRRKSNLMKPAVILWHSSR